MLYQGTEEDPGCVMAMSRNDQVGIVISGSNDFSPGQDPAISIIERTGLYIDAINDATRHSVQVGVVRGTPGIFVDGDRERIPYENDSRRKFKYCSCN